MRTGRGRTTRAEEGARGGAGWRRGILRDMPFEGTFVRRNVGRNPRSEDTVVRGWMNRGTDFRRIYSTMHLAGSFRLKSSAFRLRSPSRTWGSFGSFSFRSCRILFGIRSGSPPHGFVSHRTLPCSFLFPSTSLSWFGSTGVRPIHPHRSSDGSVLRPSDPSGCPHSFPRSENERDTPGTRSLSNQGGTRDSSGFDKARARNVRPMEDVGLDGKREGDRDGVPSTTPTTWSRQETWERWEKEG